MSILTPRISDSYRKILSLVEGEIKSDFKRSLDGFAALYMLAQNPEQRAFLELGALPLGWPVFVVRAPVYWHSTKLVARNFVRHNLFITNEIPRCIRDIWHER